MYLKVHTALITNPKISDIHLYDKVRVACWDLDEKAAVQVVCEIEEHGGSGLPIKVITSIYSWMSRMMNYSLLLNFKSII